MGNVPRPDTIAALATPPGRGGIGVLRISGPDCETIADRMIGGLPPPRHASFRRFLAPGGELIDRGIALFFPAPHSYTGEDVLELQGHGGDTVMRQLLQAALDLGARQARPGEFTERAFLNDRIDLLQAEATADLIDSASTAAARSALRSLEGDFSERVRELQEALTELRVRIEGALDFPDEDIDAMIGLDHAAALQTQISILDELLGRAEQGRLLQGGIEVVIVGRPNVGKSSLINRLVEREAAIVTDIPGTTRDPIREACLIDGLEVMLTDTAGLRDSGDRIEQEGVRRAGQALAQADLVLWVQDEPEANSAPTQDPGAPLPEAIPVIEVYNKIDLAGKKPWRSVADNGSRVIGLSALTGVGLDGLREAIKECVGYCSAGEDVFAARERHLRGLRGAREYLAEALATGATGEGPDLIAENLRLAQQSLSKLTGELSADTLLGEIFSRFCIGK